jgi:hypothetical protein
MPLLKPSKVLKEEVVRDNWPIRRRWMKAWTIGFAVNAQMLVIDMMWRGGSSLSVQIIMTLIAAICSIMGVYVFGATWDDQSKRRSLQGWRSRSSGEDDEDEDAPVPGDTKEDPIPGAPPAAQPNNAG